MNALNNDDFRKLLETPRADRTGGATPRGGAGRQPNAAASGGKPNTHKPHKPHGGARPKKPTDKREEGEDDDEPKYRDRAEERRRGKNLDYEEATAMVSNLHADVDITRLSEAETKYLGGDMRFTHLVKGLDYALLEKTRQETRKKGGVGEEADEEDDDDGGAGAAGAAAGGDLEATRAAKARAAARANATDAARKKEVVKTSLPVARGVYNTLFAPPRSLATEMYLPRRAAFVYNFDDDEAIDTDVPTTLRRPKSECPQVGESLFVNVDNAVLDRIVRIMSYIRTTADGKKLKKKDRDALLGIAGPAAEAGAAQQGGGAPKASGAAAAGQGGQQQRAADEDDDIFGDAGTDYKPTTLGKKKDQQQRDAAAASKSGYFATRDTMEDIPMPGQAVKGVAVAAGAGGGGGDDMDVEDGEALPPPPPGPPGQPHPQVRRAVTPGAYPQPQQQYGYDYGYGAQGQAAGYYGAAQPYGAAAAPHGGMLAGHQQAGKDGVATASSSLPAQFRSDPSKWRSRPSKDPAARLVEGEAAEDDDAYGEFYPSVAGFVGGDEAGSDEEDYSQMDSKGQKGMQRADFATDSEWQEYKSKRETLPRAAFQFGVKRADGRKSHKELEKGGGGGGPVGGATDKARDKKLNSQLRQIERLMEEKGHDHAGAFEKVQRTPARGGRGGGGGDAEEAVAAPAFRKRPRI